MKFETFIALRYLLSRSKGVFTVITTVIGILGVCVGVAALVTTLAVMSGFQNDIKNKVIGAQAHIMIVGSMPEGRYQKVQEAISSVKHVKASAPNILGQAILNFSDYSQGVVIRGLDAEQEKLTSDLPSSLVEGSFSKEGVSAPLVLGTELAANMGLDIDDNVVLVSPRSLAGGLPKMKRFKITGLLKTGYYEFDNTIVYTDIASASDFLGLKGGVTGLSVKLDKLDNAEKAAAAIEEATQGRYAVKTFMQLNSTLYAALKLEKVMMFIILSLIILVASLNITSNLILFGTEKLKDIGLMRAMGASPARIRRIFILEGLYIGSAGVISGIVLALVLCWAITAFDIVQLPGDIYYLTKVPVSLQWSDILSVVLGSYFLCFLSALYPAYRASKVNPVDAIRYG
ncbi:ABC transporter permease [Candidatus Proelusimicrobium excrementi]|uniref:ABC transporter permease n=2 Tax=Candidatus Proelusimicrobium excrementi TaxID=3416222 RepID=UPI003C90BBBA|nr:ABC transporter permease [Elusimicrobiaceae bacterium]